jgi:hypothetical protein
VDELYAARRAVAEDVIVTARLLLMGSWRADVDAHAGRALSSDERAAALDVAAALRQLAGDESPPEGPREDVGRHLQRRVEQGLAALAPGEPGESTQGTEC